MYQWQQLTVGGAVRVDAAGALGARVQHAVHERVTLDHKPVLARENSAILALLFTLLYFMYGTDVTFLSIYKYNIHVRIQKHYYKCIIVHCAVFPIL